MPAMLLSWGAGRWRPAGGMAYRNVAAPERLMGSVDTVNGKRRLAPGPGRWNGHPAAAYLQRPLNTKERGFMVPRSAEGLVPTQMIASGHRRDNLLTTIVMGDYERRSR